jgi:hypothetical protein
MRPQSTDASDAFNTFWKAMEHLDHVSQPLAFVTTSLGLAESPQRDLARNGSYSSDTDTEGSARSRRAFLGSRSKAQSPANSSPTTLDDARLPDATKASHLRQSVVDLRNEFDEIAEEGACLRRVLGHADRRPKITTRPTRFASFHLNLSPHRRR